MKKERSLLQRILTAVFWVPAGIAIVIAPSGYLFGIVWLAFAVFALIELVMMFSKSDGDSDIILQPNPFAAALGGVYIVSAWLAVDHPNAAWYRWAFNIGVFAAIIWEFYKAVRYKMKGSVLNLALGAFAAVYVGWFYSYFLLLRRVPGYTNLAPFGNVETGAALALLLLVTVWVGDSAAYFTGKMFGKTKLAPNISPGKTIEGFWGDLIASIIAAVLMSWWIGFSPWHGLAIGCIVGIGGPIGDLFESSIKRDAGVKDSGNFFLGHGGILDRFDALAFVTPIVFYYLVLMNLIPLHP